MERSGMQWRILLWIVKLRNALGTQAKHACVHLKPPPLGKKLGESNLQRARRRKLIFVDSNQYPAP